MRMRLGLIALLLLAAPALAHHPEERLDEVKDRVSR